MENLVFTISGLAGAGKDTVGKLIEYYCTSALGLKTFSLAYADQLKMHCIRNFNYDPENKETNRYILQSFGDKVRNIEEDFWVRQVFNTIDAFHSMFDVFIITDARYENELQPKPYYLAYPIINIFVERNESKIGEAESKHNSEKMAKDHDLTKFHYVIDNTGLIEDTYKQVVDIVDDVILKWGQYLDEQRGITTNDIERNDK